MNKLTQTEIIKTSYVEHALGLIGEVKFGPCYYTKDNQYRFQGGVRFRIGYSYDLGELPTSKTDLIKKIRLMLLDALNDLEKIDQ